MGINKAAAAAAKKQANKNVVANSIEGLRSIGDEFQKTAKNEAVASWKDTWSQILSVDFNGKGEAPPAKKAIEAEKNLDPTKGPVELFSAKNHKGEGEPKKKPESKQAAAMDHGHEVKKVAETALKRVTQEKRSEIEQIKSELKQIKAPVNKEVDRQKLNHAPKQIGNYDVVFFAGLLKSAQMSKEKAADSGSWLSAVKGKNAKRGDFSIANGKMHQSGERTTVQNAAG